MRVRSTTRRAPLANSCHDRQPRRVAQTPTSLPRVHVDTASRSCEPGYLASHDHSSVASPAIRTPAVWPRTRQWWIIRDPAPCPDPASLVTTIVVRCVRPPSMKPALFQLYQRGRFLRKPQPRERLMGIVANDRSQRRHHHVQCPATPQRRPPESGWPSASSTAR